LLAGCIEPGPAWPPCPHIEQFQVDLEIIGTQDILVEAHIDSIGYQQLMMSCAAAGGWYDFTRTSRSTATATVTAFDYANLRLVFFDSVVRLQGDLGIHRNTTIVVDRAQDNVSATVNGVEANIVRHEILDDPNLLTPLDRTEYFPLGTRIEANWTVAVNSSWNRGGLVTVGTNPIGILGRSSQVEFLAPNGTLMKRVAPTDDEIRASLGPFEKGEWRIHVVIVTPPGTGGVWVNRIFTY
jgi:hypothetical protein